MPLPDAFEAAFNHSPAIWHPVAPREGFVVVLFRRHFTVEKIRRHTVLWVSASERFEFFLDGKLIARGPSRSDPLRWGVAKLILPRLVAGEHLFAVRVAHFGDAAGIGQLGCPGFFYYTRKNFQSFIATGNGAVFTNARVSLSRATSGGARGVTMWWARASGFVADFCRRVGSSRLLMTGNGCPRG